MPTLIGSINAARWEENRAKLARLSNLAVINLPPDACRILTRLAQRTMRVQCAVQEGQVWIGDGNESVPIELKVWKRSNESDHS